MLFNIRDVRNRHCVNLNVENTKTFSNDPEDPSAAALKVRTVEVVVILDEMIDDSMKGDGAGE